MANEDQARALLEALKPALQQMITETVDGLRNKNSELIDREKRAKTERDDAIARADEAMQKLRQVLEGSERIAPSKPTGPDLGTEFVLTREQARDPQTYREMRAKAEKAGKPLRIVEEAEGRDPHWRNAPGRMAASEIAKTHTISLDDTHHKVRYVRADHQTGTGLVQRRLEAEREGYRIVTWRQPSDLPQHMQTKLALQEKAAEASDGSA